MSESVWVAQLNISNKTAEKIDGKHRMSKAEVRENVVCVPGLPFSWDHDEERGLRAIVRVPMRGKQWYVVLYPVPHPMGDVWNLGSVYPDE